MNLPKVNSSIRLEDGRTARIERFLGEGAQGAVFAVDIDGEKKALKWYKMPLPAGFIENLRNNIDRGTPSDVFLWPEALARPMLGSAGYVMPLKPEGMVEFSKFRLGRTRFRSMAAVITAAIDMCVAFKALHAFGLSFQDLNDGGFFVDPASGHLRICDCDNVAPHGVCSGILGKARYMAPEIVAGRSLPNSYTDRFSMTLMMFMFFCVDHPFEGFNTLRNVCLTEEIERRLYGDELTFIFDAENDGNRPVRGIHRNVLTIWPLMPQGLRKAFTEEFSHQRLNDPQHRMTESQWLDVLLSVHDCLVRCPRCGDEVFADSASACLNPACAQPCTPRVFLKSTKRTVALMPAKAIRLASADKVDARVVAKPGADDILLLQNLGKESWSITTPSGKSLTVFSGGFCPVKPGIEIKTLQNNILNSFKIF